MPADFVYWNPAADRDSGEESVSLPYPRRRVDPWDLENYVYIREHLDPREILSQASSLEETLLEAGSSYYDPLKESFSSRPLFDSLQESEYAGGANAKYAEIEEIYRDEDRHSGYCSLESEMQRGEDGKKYGVLSLGLEPYIPSSICSRGPPSGIYDTMGHHHHHHHHHHYPKHEDRIKRRMSYSYGDYEYNQDSPQSLYARLEGPRSESERPSPIYDDIKLIGRFTKPDNFGLSNYGHLQIDYSCSWNNLDKYIYN